MYKIKYAMCEYFLCYIRSRNNISFDDYHYDVAYEEIVHLSPLAIYAVLNTYHDKKRDNAIRYEFHHMPDYYSMRAF